MSLRVSLLLILLTTGCASNRWIDLAVHDAKAIVTSPATAAPQTWKKAAVVTGAVLAASTLDDELRDVARANQGRIGRNISEVVTPFGGRYSDRVLLGFLAAGLINRDDRAKSVAFDAYVSSIIASKIITPTLKQTFDRSRPSVAEDATDFSGGESFPSNHATQAFLMATVVAHHYDSPWVDRGAYALAALVSLARMYDDAHWLSDVIAGAAIGTATARFITATHDRYRARWTAVPVYDAQRRGVVVVIRR